MKLLLLSLTISLTSFAQSYTASQIKEISIKATDSGEVRKELKAFSQTGNYEVYMEFNNLKDKPVKVGPIPSKTKIGNKNAIVMTAPLPDGNTFYMLITYDEKLEVYHKFLLGPDDKPIKMTGLSKDHKTVAWSLVSPSGEVTLSQEKNTLNGSEWYSVTMKDGKIIKTEKGSAKFKK